jgi:hypothetical protein
MKLKRIKKIRDSIKSRVDKSYRTGILFIIRHSWSDIKKRVVQAKLLRQAKDRGFCIWCQEAITKNKACFQVCEGCLSFEGDDFMCAKCYVQEQPCEKCKQIPYFESQRRVQ